MKCTKFKSKTEKGITLIALIITIVVLMILAAVAISSIQNDGIIAHANNAVNQYEQKQAEESTFLEEYLDYLNNNAGLSGENTEDEGEGEEDENTDTTAPTAPTEITATAVSGRTVTLQATGGTDESGTVAGYQYSMDGTTWSETIASGTGYTTAELTSGTNWTVYAKTIDGAGNASTTAMEYTIISFSVNNTTYYAKEGMNWEVYIESVYNSEDAFDVESVTVRIVGGAALRDNEMPVYSIDMVSEGRIYSLAAADAPGQE